MKVIQAVGWYFPTSTGGTEVYVRSVARHLRAAGVEVLIAAPLAGAAAPSSYIHDGVSVFRYPIPASANRAEVRGDVLVRGAEHLHRWLSHEKPDVVHFHTLLTGLDLTEIEAARSVGARVLVTSHTSALGYLCPRGTLLRWGKEACDGIVSRATCTACLLQRRGVPRGAAWLLASTPSPISDVLDRVERPFGTGMGMSAYVRARRERQSALFTRIEGFHVLTERGRRALIANGAPEQKISLNRLGTDTTTAGRFARSAGRPLTIGFLGRLDPVKGLDVVLRAVDALRGVDLRLDVRGIATSEFPDVLAGLQHAIAADTRITYGGPVAETDVPAVLAAWDVLVCPGKSLEGGPTVALEALAVGTPVISSDVGGVAEILADGVNSRLLRPGDWRTLATVLGELARFPDILAGWRQRLPRPRTMSDVADQYIRSYIAA